MPAADFVDPVVDRLRSVALALLALFFVLLMFAWAGAQGLLFDLLGLVAAFFAGFVLLQVGHRTADRPALFAGGGLLFAVFVTFLLRFTGRGLLDGAVVGVAAAGVGAWAAWPRSVFLERAMVAVGAIGTVALLLLPPVSRFGEALLFASAALLTFALLVAATKPQTG